MARHNASREGSAAGTDQAWRRPRTSRPGRQDGAFAIMFVPLLIVIIGFCGLAVDAGLIYNRKVDVYGIAKAAALAAARELNGTPAGIAAARTAARETVEALRYRHYNAGAAVSWSDDALSFSDSPDRDGTWIPSATAGGSPSATLSGLYFARVDTARLAPEIGEVTTFFIRILASHLSSIQVSDSAVAGRTSVNVTPIGICAMSSDAASVRTATTGTGATLSELVQYGFRRGVSYDLMNLNPVPGSTAPLRFAINPEAAAGAAGNAFGIADLEPFVCRGSMWVPRVTGRRMRVSELPSSAPLASLRAALNTRFDEYSGTTCTARGAPPDINIKSYAYDVSGAVKWMSPGTGSRSAERTDSRGKIETVADVTDPPESPGQYGPLWAFAKAVRAPSPLTTPEPASGYTPFGIGNWPDLYKSGPTAPSYPSNPPTPYQSSLASTGNYLAPSPTNRPLAVPRRRVLNIPLLECLPTAPSGTNTQAAVTGIGKFFMTVQATDEKLIAEFAGLASEQSLSGQVELFP